MKLSERIYNKWDDPELLVGWFYDTADEVAQLEAERDGYRTQYHMAEVKVLSRDALLEQLSEEQLTKDVAQLEEENAALLEALQNITYIVKGSKAQMENQIDFARRTATEAIRKAS